MTVVSSPPFSRASKIRHRMMLLPQPALVHNLVKAFGVGLLICVPPLLTYAHV